MSATLMLSEWIGCLEGRARAGGLDAAGARRRVASRLGVAPGTLENIRKGRSKRAEPGLIERVRAAVEDALISEMKALDHELAVVRACDRPLDRDAMSEAEAALERARALLMETRR